MTPRPENQCPDKSQCGDLGKSEAHARVAGDEAHPFPGYKAKNAAYWRRRALKAATRIAELEGEVQRATDEALERAAKVCDALAQSNEYMPPTDCAYSIRALITEPGRDIEQMIDRVLSQPHADEYCPICGYDGMWGGMKNQREHVREVLEDASRV